MKKFISVILSVIMLAGVFAVMPLTAYARYDDYEQKKNDEYEYLLNKDGTVEVYSYLGKDSEVVIPDTIEDCPVTGISSYAFEGCDFVTKISIPDTVTIVGDNAFSDTEYYNNENNWENGVLYIDKVLYEVSEDVKGEFTVKDGTTAIAYYAFMGCTEITKISIPGSVKILPYRTFRGCTSLTDLNVGEGTEIIEDQAFSFCVKLNNINLPKTITRVGLAAFNNTAFYNDEYNWDNGALYLGNILLILDSESTGAYTVREGTEVIADSAFEGCNITKLYLPSGLKILPYGALNLCKHLKYIYFNDDLEEIASLCFPTSSEMTSLELPKNVTKIDYRAVAYTSYSEVKLPENLKTVDADAFISCDNLKEITIPAGVEKIGQEAFGYTAHIYITEEDQGYYTTKMEDFVIKGYPNTLAESYANEHGFKFVDLTKEPEKTDISSFTAKLTKTSYTYTGKAIKPAVTVTNLSSDNYTIAYKNNTKVGTAAVTITGKGDYTGTITKTFKITKAANPITVKAKTITAKTKKNTSFSKSKAFTISKAQGKVTFKKASGNKKITINKAGKITVKKGLKKAKTYSLKVKVTANGNSNYKSGTKTVTVKIKIK